MNSVRFLSLMIFPALMSLPTFAQSISGVMMVVKGDVKVSSPDGKTEAAKVGKKVAQGDTITAGADSRAKIVMSDKNVLNVSPDSKIIIEKYENDGKDKKEVELNVVYGKVRASVEQKYDGEKSKFNIKTPSAVAGVRGTDFITGYDRGTKVTRIITFAGTVAVGTPGPGGTIRNPVFVQPGQMTEAGNGKAPEAPKAVPKEELNKMNNESKADTASNKQDSPQKEVKKEEKKDKEDKKDSDKSAATDKKNDKKDAKKEPVAAAPAGEAPRNPASAEPAAAGPAPTVGTPSPAGGMMPADVGRAPSMFDPSKDNPGSVGNMIIPSTGPTGPGLIPIMPPPIAGATPPPLTEFIRNGQKSRTTIILNPQ